MKALCIESFEGLDAISLKDIEEREPNPSEVKIAVKAASLNPVDWKIAEGLFKGLIPHTFPITLGWDVSGVVVSSKDRGLPKGSNVFAYVRKPSIHEGSFAEFVCHKADEIALKPKNLDFIESAAIPLVGLTSYQALVDIACLRSGESILIHAGAGGVGSFAIQLAKLLGAKVFTTCSKSNFDYVKRLGADVVIDYTSESFRQAVLSYEKEGVDVVYDTVGYDTAEDSLKTVKKGGRYVSIVTKPDLEKAKERGVTAGYVFVRPNKAQLKKIADAIEMEKILPPEIQTVPLASYKEAFQKSKEGHVRGKIVLTIG